MTVLKNNKKVPVWDYDMRDTYCCPHCKSLIEYGVEDIKQSEIIKPACHNANKHYQEKHIQVNYIQCPVCEYEINLCELEVAMFIKQWREITDEEAFPDEAEEERAYRLQRQEQLKKEEEEDDISNIVFGIVYGFMVFMLLVGLIAACSI